MKRSHWKWAAIGLSILGHIALAAWLLLAPDSQPENSRWRGGGAIWVSVSDLAPGTAELPNPSPANPGAIKPSLATPVPVKLPTQKQNTTGGTSQNAGAGGNGIDTDGTSSPSTLAQIRARIDRRKFMPSAASEQGLAGTVKLSFQIGPAGEVEALTLLKSSGHAVLDKAALTTVQKAAPLPHYKKPIAIELEYQ